MLGVHILDDEIMIDDPAIIGQLEEFANDWSCTPEQAFCRVIEREAASRGLLETPE